MEIIFKPISALEKCFLDESIDSKPLCERGVALCGEEHAFEIAYTLSEPVRDIKVLGTLEISSPLRDCITVREIDSVPVLSPKYSYSDDNFVRDTPGLYPDLLRPIRKNLVPASYGLLKSLYVTVDVPEDAAAGDYPIDISFVYGESRATAHYVLHVIGAVLPKQDLIYTQWFYTDCIAQYYGLEVFSDKHWDYIEKFMRVARKNGVNAILTPVFTPPLDTAIGHERLTTQLVDVKKTADGWEFGYGKFEKWVEIAERVGMDCYEISHLYTQWGAHHAPKVMAEVDGELKRVFGWDTDCLSDEYRVFLRSFLTSFLAKAKEMGIDKRCLFHISDEPYIDKLEAYKAAKAQIADILEGYTIMDALSSFEFYSTGAVSNPIPATNHIEPFLEAGIENLWTYYCCSQSVGVSNRYIAMPMQRGRVIGMQMYKYKIAGFLHWGYNYYNSQYSWYTVNPFVVTDGDFFAPAGDAFSVYPGEGGEALESLHQKCFTMALEDLRTLKLAESLIGRDAVVAIIDAESPITFADYPHSDEWLEGVMARVRDEIEKSIASRA